MTTGMIINALGILDNPNAPHSLAAAHKLVQDSEDLTVDERTIADAHDSGLTAVTITLGYTIGDAEPYAHTLREIEVWDRIIAEHSDDLVKVLTPDDIRAAHRDGRIGVVYGFQNAVALDYDLSRVHQFRDLGVRVIQLTYNQANELGDGAMAPDNRGLTPFGREAVEALCDSRIMVDLSHSGENTCLDAIRLAKLPVSINHTGCRALVDLPRNKTDEELRLVAESGGFVGIYFMPFVHPTGHARAADVVEHIVHAVNVCGEEHVGIGTDGSVTSIDDLDAYQSRLAEHVAQRKAAGVGAAGERADTYPFVVDLRGVGQFRRLIELLAQRGFSDERIDKIMGRNFLAYADRVWTA
ncbi:membrane dipeptidase [Hamadaea flava]|uniref:Dipeptidase n=1 Tax=Hamadaea flava TaxID=1742688 RepID=A0ABV8LW44_9ACTN|nr:membrane dipeptidase [Hamadaea flava]MCP2329330.1 membrane dipeptidase [Hamadaea flava]